MYRQMNKVLKTLCLLISIVVLRFFGFVQYAICQFATLDFSFTKNYRLEYGSVSLPWTYKKYAYIRITQVSHPASVYRSPVIDADSNDLRGRETDKSIVIYWLSFDKEDHHFRLSFPGWRESWIDLSISNTKYTVIANG
jgi:hypothetical protein